ncbi:MAG: SRPBCC family protein [Flavobacteriales bacterium]|jgi:ligand-binding SRPBCC domain-containing protein
MKVYTLERQTVLHTTIDKAWDYFSRPENLNEITPDDMQFRILTDVSGKKMHAGMIINYRIQPAPFMTFGWTTEISQSVDKRFFVDEQRFGPYAFWHHQHHFEDKGTHVLMTDIVNYAMPLGILGRIAHAVWVKNKLKGIFDYRTHVIDRIFPH